MGKLDNWALEDLLFEASNVFTSCEYILALYENADQSDKEYLEYLKKELLKQSRAHERLTKKIKSVREQEFLSSPYFVPEDEENNPVKWLLRIPHSSLDSP